LDSALTKLAQLLVDYSARVKEGDLVLIEAPVLAEPLVREVYRHALRAGAQPRTRVALGPLLETLMFEGSDDQLDWENPARAEDIERADVRIVIHAPTNTKALTTVDPKRQARYARTNERLKNRYLERAAAGELRWTVTAYPTTAAAQDAEMSLADYQEFVFRAGFLDADDPAARWEEFGEELERVAAFLRQRRELRVVADGTDLTLGVEGRNWIPSKGHENLPDGEVFTAPVETSVDGEIRFTSPGVYQGREVEDVRLRFSGGEVVEARADRGQELLEAMLSVDDGARRAGEFAFGLNRAVGVFTRNILFDEKIGGTVHLALGTSYPECGGENRSGLHWDMICDLRTGSEVYADGELVYRDGAFLNGLG
jgi:aminopeptidase